jgi:hypothetical protein
MLTLLFLPGFQLPLLAHHDDPGGSSLLSRAQARNKGIRPVLHLFRVPHHVWICLPYNGGIRNCCIQVSCLIALFKITPVIQEIFRSLWPIAYLLHGPFKSTLI